MIFVADVAWTSGERSGLPDCRAGECPHPVGDPVGVDDADLEAAVVGACVVEHFDAAEETTDVADEDAARRACVPRHAVDIDLRLERLRAQVLGACPDVGDPPETVLERPIRLLDHGRVEAGAGHDGEPLAVEAADVELPPLPVQADCDGPLDVLRDPEIGREQVRSAGGEDHQRRVRACHRVDAPLERSVTAPHEEQLGPLGECALYLLRREAALRHLDPQRIIHALPLQLASQLG